MSSNLETTLKAILIDDYTSIVIVIVATYDYVLTFSREVDYIWCKPWTCVSTLFVIIRYLGLCWTIMLALVGNAFLPGSVNVRIAMLLVGDWAYVLFLAAADLAMILRVYAMWDQSKIILGILFTIYVPLVVVSFVWNGIYDDPHKTFSVTVTEVLDLTYCSYSFSMTPSWMIYRAIPRFVLSDALLILAVIPTLKQSVEMYRLTKRWQTNRTMMLLVREGVLYFVLTLLFNVLVVFQPGYPLSTDLMLFLVAFSYSVSYVIMPRFIINIRELYARDPRKQWHGIDTGFGIFSQPTADMELSVVVVVDVAREGDHGETAEAIQLEVGQ